ncbi:hypothetical protein HanRHA438_Chr16g0741471 [Helianthus annuus]|nr:hypothetical protein HanRHA438_Chr16g0741471 [Helianthus annuus]
MELRSGKVPSKNMENIPLSGIKYFRSPFRKQEHTPSSRLVLRKLLPRIGRNISLQRDPVLKKPLPRIGRNTSSPAGSNLKETPSKNRKEHIPHSRFSLEEAPSKNMK